MFSLSSFSQKSDFIINGYIKGLDKGRIELVDLLGDTSILVKNRKVLIENGKFSFTGTIPHTFVAKFRLNDSVFTGSLFIDHGIQRTDLNFDSIKNSTVINSSANNFEYISTYKEKMKFVDDEIETWDSIYSILGDRFHQKIPMNVEDSMQSQYQLLINKKDSTFLNYVKGNSKSEVALWHLFYKSYYGDFKSIYNTTYDYFDDNLKKSIMGLELKRILELGKKTVIGELFPALTVINAAGVEKQIKLGSSNKYLLIDIWFSSCGPCLGQFKDLKAIFEKYRSKGFSIIGISVDINEKKSDWLNVIAKYGLEWPQYWDVDGKEIKKLNIHAFPMNFLLDKYGKILKKDMSPAEVDAFLNKQILYN